MTPTVTVHLHLWSSSRARLLTERERVVLGLVACGFDNDEIARMEGVSLSTIRSQLHSVMGKLNCRNRTQLVMVALLAGLIDVDTVVGQWKRHAPEVFEEAAI